MGTRKKKDRVKANQEQRAVDHRRLMRERQEQAVKQRQQEAANRARAALDKELGIFTGTMQFTEDEMNKILGGERQASRKQFVYADPASGLDHGAQVEAQMLPNGQIRITNVTIKKRLPARRWKFVPQSRMRVFPIETMPTGEDGYRTVVAVGAWRRQWFYFELIERPEAPPQRGGPSLAGRWDEEANAFMGRRAPRNMYEHMFGSWANGDHTVRFSNVGGLMLPITREAARLKLAPVLAISKEVTPVVFNLARDTMAAELAKMIDDDIYKRYMGGK